jgi:hypothetical protein
MSVAVRGWPGLDARLSRSSRVHGTTALVERLEDAPSLADPMWRRPGDHLLIRNKKNAWWLNPQPRTLQRRWANARA